MEAMVEEKPSSELLGEYAGLLWRWSWLLVLLALLTGGVSYYYTNQQPRVYQASTLVLINGAPGIQNDPYSSLSVGGYLTDTYAHIMTTAPIYIEVAKRLGLSGFPASVQVSTIQNTQLLNVIVTDSDPDRAALIANTLVKVFDEQISTDQALRYADSKTNLEKQMASLEQEIKAGNDALSALDTNDAKQVQRAQLEADLANYRQAYSAYNSTYQSVRLAEIQAWPEQAAHFAELETNLETQMATLSFQIKSTNDALIALGLSDTSQAKRTLLADNLNNSRNSYNNLLQSYEQIRLAQTQSSPTIIQKQPAVPQRSPIQPQPLKTALLAALVGLFIGVGIVFLMEFLDDTLKNPQEITRKWGIPILAMIVNFPSDNGNGLITYAQPRSPVSEAFRALRTNLRFAGVDYSIRSLVITSPSPQDGKTTIASNLSMVVAQSGRKVVLVDADLRRPTVHKLLHLPNRVGLTDVFVQLHGDLQAVVQETEQEYLYAITSGATPPNPSELLGSIRMTDIMDQLKKQYDFIVLDTPPSLMVTDANLLAPFVDGVLLVIKPSKTKRAAIWHTIESLLQVKAHIIGVVLNDVDIKNSKYYYYRGYYHKYGYSYNDSENETKA